MHTSWHGLYVRTLVALGRLGSSWRTIFLLSSSFFSLRSRASAFSLASRCASSSAFFFFFSMPSAPFFAFFNADCVGSSYGVLASLRIWNGPSGWV